MTAPLAEVVKVYRAEVTVRCPYCDGLHTHEIVKRGLSEHRAPPCGMYRTPEQRAIGYRFTATTNTL